jgi:hypothetical protein
LRAGYEDPREGFVGLAITFDETKSEIEAFGDVFGYATNLSYAFQDAADDVQNVLVNSISTLNSATDTLSGSQDLTLDVVARVRGVAQETITALDRFALAILTFPLYLTEVRDDALSFLALKSSLFDLLRQLDLARTGAIENEQAMAARQAPRVIAEVRAPQGSDLRDLARVYYGDPDMWGIIADFNGLDSSLVPVIPTGPSDNPARSIRIPQRPEGDLGNVLTAC